MNKSYLKYAGGKARILDDVLATLPMKIDRFVEPFTGSGTVALNVDANHYLLSDLNGDVINCHLQVRDNPMELLYVLDQLYAQGRDTYYKLRDKFNARTSNAIEQAALFIYMNKHGFNGMCRYSKNGFNVPVGKGNIHHPGKEILACSDLFTKAMFATVGFETVFSILKDDDVVYCDPPYVPISATLSDINYTGEPFTINKQIALADLAEASKAHVVISNHDTPVTRNLYKNADAICTVEAHRSISCSSATRGKVQELLAIYYAK